MDNSPVKNPFGDVTFEDVYEAARTQGAIERIFEDFKSCVKNSDSYTILMDATKQNILGDHFVTMPISDLQSKKKKLQEIAKIASKFHASVSEICSATTEIEGRPVIEKLIKQLSYLKRESAAKVVSPSKKEQIYENNNSEDINVKGYDKQQPGTSEKICDVNKACKSMVEEKKKMPIIREPVKTTSKASVSSKRKGSGETDILPKRQRKPNSRYNLKH